jgi:hypothetical protein
METDGSQSTTVRNSPERQKMPSPRGFRDRFRLMAQDVPAGPY